MRIKDHGNEFTMLRHDNAVASFASKIKIFAEMKLNF